MEAVSQADSESKSRSWSSSVVQNGDGVGVGVGEIVHLARGRWSVDGAGIGIGAGAVVRTGVGERERERDDVREMGTTNGRGVGFTRNAVGAWPVGRVGASVGADVEGESTVPDRRRAGEREGEGEGG